MTTPPLGREGDPMLHVSRNACFRGSSWSRILSSTAPPRAALRERPRPARRSSVALRAERRRDAASLGSRRFAFPSLGASRVPRPRDGRSRAHASRGAEAQTAPFRESSWTQAPVAKQSASASLKRGRAPDRIAGVRSRHSERLTTAAPLRIPPSRRCAAKLCRAGIPQYRLSNGRTRGRRFVARHRVVPP